MSNSPSVSEVLGRLAQALGADTETALAEKLGVARSTLGSWKSRGSIPYAECVMVAERDDISLDWLVLGRYQEPGETLRCGEPRPEFAKYENVFVFDRVAERLLVCLQALDEVPGGDQGITLSPEDRRAWAIGAYHAIGRELEPGADLDTWRRFARQLARITAAMPRR